MAQHDVHDELLDSIREAPGPGPVPPELGVVSGLEDGQGPVWSLLDARHRDCGCSLAEGQHPGRQTVAAS